MQPQGSVAVGETEFLIGTHGFDWWVWVGHKGELELVHGHMDKQKGFQPPSLSKYQPEKAKKM